MSRWTHVIGSIYLETYKEEKNIEKYVKNIIGKAPKIVGSEKNCDVFVNALTGYNTWTNCDCENCKYKDTIKYIEDGYFQCGAKNDNMCLESKYQTCVVITLVGDLRDRSGQETCKDISDFIIYLLKTGMTIDCYSVKVIDDYEGSSSLYIKEDEGYCGDYDETKIKINWSDWNV